MYDTDQFDVLHESWDYSSASQLLQQTVPSSRIGYSKRRGNDNDNASVEYSRVTITTESYKKNGATTTPRVNFYGYVGHVTMFSWRMLAIACCLEVGLWLELGLDSASGWSGYAHVFVLLSVVVVALPLRIVSRSCVRCKCCSLAPGANSSEQL